MAATAFATPHVDTANTRTLSLRTVIDRNTLVWWAILLISVVLGASLSPWWYLFWLGAMAFDDVVLYGFGRSVLFGQSAMSAAAMGIG
jgi:hypothetical protein